MLLISIVFFVVVIFLLYVIWNTKPPVNLLPYGVSPQTDSIDVYQYVDNTFSLSAATVACGTSTDCWAFTWDGSRTGLIKKGYNTFPGQPSVNLYQLVRDDPQNTPSFQPHSTSS